MSEYTQRYDDKWFSNATPINAVKASVNLTVDTLVTATDTITVGGKLYTFVADGAASADGDISVGTDASESQANIVAAINGTDSINTANEYVTAGDFNVSDVSVITAILVGTEGNSIATVSDLTTGTNVFSAVVLSGGLYATPVRCATFIIISGVWYIAEKAVDKWNTTGWKSSTPSVI